jgi:mannosyltransferase OCH1-like enzyme
MAQFFPKLIWQTYKSETELPSESGNCIRSWLDQNPTWEHHFCSDEDILEFFSTFYEGRLLDLYQAMPLGVMKADLWRYAVIHEFGGIYADIDTVCLAPLDEWLDLEHGKGLQVASEGSHPYFCQWTFAAKAGHPALKHALDLIAERVAASGGVVDEKMPHYVHHYTGPSMWTAAVQRYLGTDLDAFELLAAPELWAEHDIHIHPRDFFNGGKVLHYFAGEHWRKSRSGYASWMEERKDEGRLEKEEFDWSSCGCC